MLTRMAWPIIALSAALCLADDAGTPEDSADKPDGWAPPAIATGAYDDITAYNIFEPNRAALAAEAQREPEPDEPEDLTPIEPVVDLPPPDPDAALVLVGVSIHGEVATAHIEDRSTGDIIVLDKPGPFSEGEIQAIALQGITYRVGDEARSIRIGQALTGEAPEPSTPGSRPTTTTDDSTVAAPDGAGDNSDTPPDDGLTDLERRMRERRNSE